MRPSLGISRRVKHCLPGRFQPRRRRSLELGHNNATKHGIICISVSDTLPFHKPIPIGQNVVIRYDNEIAFDPPHSRIERDAFSRPRLKKIGKRQAILPFKNQIFGIIIA